MDKLIQNTRNKFIVTILFVVIFVVSISWGMLQVYNQREVASPASSSEVHSSAIENEAFAEYLEDQKAFEAHFITLASSIKEQEADRVTRGLALTSVIAVTTGTIVALFAARKLMHPVVQAYESQERFIQDAAHELRNPLAAMTAALQQTKESTPLVKTFTRQTKRLVLINEDLLFLERRNKQEPSMLLISDLLLDVVEELQPLAVRKKIKLEVTTDKDIHKKMSADDYVRLVKNIIDNAIKYSTPQSKVVIKQRKDKGSITIIVKDQGIGIPQKDLENIGNRFFRAGNTGTIEGTGLGLAIVQKILNTYGGSKTIESTPKKGTKVTLSLPA